MQNSGSAAWDIHKALRAFSLYNKFRDKQGNLFNYSG